MFLSVQQYVEELRACLQTEAAHQPLTPAAVRVVKLANEIVGLHGPPVKSLPEKFPRESVLFWGLVVRSGFCSMN